MWGSRDPAGGCLAILLFFIYDLEGFQKGNDCNGNRVNLNQTTPNN